MPNLFLLVFFLLESIAVQLQVQPNSLASSRPSSPISQAGLALQFSDIIAKKVRVIVDPVRVLDENGTLWDGKDKEKPVCVLALHREECQGPRIRPNERIRWQDRVCILMRCLRAEGLAMRVQDCWAGSAQSPILLIDRHGCTREGSMLSTPRYKPLNQSAYSLGWLTVRLPDLDHIRLSCAVKFCSICDAKCRMQTPPAKCMDSGDRHGDGWWAKQMQREGHSILEQMCTEKTVTANVGTGIRRLGIIWIVFSISVFFTLIPLIRLCSIPILL